MLNHSIPIGTDAQGSPVRFPADHIPHTLITGGSGTDRERILRSLAESARAAGIPVFLTDTRGSLSGLSSAVPCTLWDLKGSTGLPLRTTVTELGPLLLTKLLGLNDRQSDLLRIVFRIADENGLLLIDTKDLKALLNEISDNSAAYEKEYGTFPDESVTAIRSAVVSLETKGAADYLFEPAIDGEDLLTDAESGETRIHVLDTRNQAGEGTLYAVFLLFMLGEFCENMPDREEGEPFRFLFMIDEAQLFFRELSDSFTGKVGQLLEGLEAKGVAVFFAAAEDQTLPEVLEYTVGQRLQVQSQTQALLFRGEDDASAEGIPVTLAPFRSRTKALTAQERQKLTAADPLHEKYKIPFDRDSAYEFLKRRGLDEEAAAVAEAAESAEKERAAEGSAAEGSATEAGTAVESTETDAAEENAEADAAQTAAAEENSETKSAEEADEKSETSGKEAAEKNADKEAMVKRAKSSAKSLGNTVAGTVGRQVGKSIGSVFGDFGETLGGNIGASLGRGIVNTLFKS